MSGAGTATPIRIGPLVVVGLIAAIGLANGLLTLLAFGTLGAGWNTLGNSGAIWLLVAFAVGALMPSAGLAIAGATASLVGSVVWFYLAAHYVVGFPISSAGIAVWLVAALAGGPLYGLAGHWWRTGSGARHVVGFALMGGVFMAEGIFTLLHDPLLPIVGWVAVAIGALFTFALARSTRDRLLGLVALPVVTALALVAYTAIYGAFALI